METATTKSTKLRKIYLRGPKGDTKKVLVLLAGVLYEAEYTVSCYEDLGGDKCEVLDVTDTYIHVRLGTGVENIFTRQALAAAPAQLELPFAVAA